MQGEHERACAEQIGRLCRLAGADEDLIPQWVEEGRRLAQARRMPRSVIRAYTAAPVSASCE